ncbi:MAG: UDP-3-O-acyl-N-acetylglucosamine deacetylase [Phycisphaeraceae bacterium]|nr:MAG: UDP-3-O-acyl-N-acetylglucosamine deacetylase [Phycisphaeraceae bacterium]
MTIGATLRRAATLTGIGLFTGQPSTVILRPATSRTGLAFTLGPATFPASIDRLAPSPIPAFAHHPARHTCLAAPDGPALATVEHALSALVGMGITDATVESFGPELPIFDGSSLRFVEQIRAVGSVPSETPATDPITLDAPISIENDGASILISPRHTPGISYTYRLAYPAPIGEQSAHWDGRPETYAADIAPARTFSLEHEARAMRSLGLFQSFTPRDMLVIGPEGPIDNTLRYPDEPARHKLLDLIGDLALAGPLMPRLQADIVATRSGHALAHAAARALQHHLNSRG